MKTSNYYGTEVNGKWWRRYRGVAFFARGNGDFSMTEAGIEFRKTLTKRPLEIGWGEICAVEIGTWHAGRWGGRRQILKVVFERDGDRLSAGFAISKDDAAMQQLVDDLRRKIST